MFVFMTLSHFRFVVGFDIRKCEYYSFVLQKTVLAIWGPLKFHIDFRMNFLIAKKKKKKIGDFDKNCIESVDLFP